MTLKHALESDTSLESVSNMLTDCIYDLPMEADRLFIESILPRYLHEQALEDDYAFFEGLPYKSVQVGNLMWYGEMINRFPDFDDSELFGIPNMLHESRDLLDNIAKFNGEYHAPIEQIRDLKYMITELESAMPKYLEVHIAPDKKGRPQVALRTFELKKLTARRTIQPT